MNERNTSALGQVVMGRARPAYRTGHEIADGVSECWHQLWQSARAAWPGVELGEAEFVRYLRERTPDTVEGVCAIDLYLACACLARIPGAVERFETVLLAQVPALISRLRPPPALIDEVLQSLRVRLFVGSEDATPRIAQYSGRGSLLGWLRVTALHATLDLLRSREPHEDPSLHGSRLAEALADDAEVELMKGAYKQELEAAVITALRGLPRGDRTLLRLHLVEGITTLRLSKVFHLSQASVIRRIAALRLKVQGVVYQHLSERLRLSRQELDSVARLLLSRLDISLAACLRSRTR